MHTHVSQWGNSLAVRLPRAVANEVGLKNGEPVDLSLERGRVVIATRRPHYRLRDLLRHVTAANIHRAVDTGEPVGREVW